MREVAGYIPEIGEEEFEQKILKFQDLEVEIPLLTKKQMNKVIETVKKGSAETLKSLTLSEIVNIIDKVTDRLLDRSSSYRQKAEKKAAERESKTKMTLVVSRIDGVWNGAASGDVIHLEDGTAWRVANKGEHYGGYADHPAVAIFKSLFGWKMRVSSIAEFYVMPVKQN
jgi:hypothetical protein